MSSFDRSSRGMFLLPALLGMWLVLVCVALMRVDPTHGILAISLLAFTAVIALVNLFPYAGWVAAIMSVVVLALVFVYSDLTDAMSLTIVAVEGVCVLFTALVAAVVVRSLNSTTTQLERDRRLIKELALFDEKTGLLEWQHASRSLRTEISRSQRYEREICLLLLQPLEQKVEGAEGGGKFNSQNSQAELAAVLMESVRTVDVPFVHSATIGAILPETDPSGALVVAERLERKWALRARLGVAQSIAHFPTDAVTVEGLMSAAQAALQVAVTADHPLVFYSQIRMAMEQNELESRVVPEEGGGAKTPKWEPLVISGRIEDTGKQ